MNRTKLKMLSSVRHHWYTVKEDHPPLSVSFAVEFYPDLQTGMTLVHTDEHTMKLVDTNQHENSVTNTCKTSKNISMIFNPLILLQVVWFFSRGLTYKI